MEQNHIAKVLRSTGGRIRGTGGAAEILGLKPSTLESRMKKLGISRTV
jgi:transcriptional regulator with GAF, ATPase, and Fis domain